MRPAGRVLTSGGAVDDAPASSGMRWCSFRPSVRFITPDLLGGAMMIGNLIQHEYLVVRDSAVGPPCRLF